MPTEFPALTAVPTTLGPSPGREPTPIYDRFPQTPATGSETEPTEFLDRLKHGQETTPSRERLSEAEEKVFAQLVPQHEASAIDINDFEALYGAERVKHDMESVAKKKARIKEAHTEPTKRAKILEALLSEQIELSNWFGEEALTIIPSEYDDLFNGVDVAIEFERDGGYRYMAAGIDVTSSAAAIQKKLAIIKEHISNESLSRIKYFMSERTDFKGEMGKIPGIVIGADSKTIREISELWLQANAQRLGRNLSGLSQESIDSQKSLAREAKDKLAGHRIQVLLLKQIDMQLRAYLDFARKNNKNEVTTKYESLLELTGQLLTEKNITPEDDSLNEKDSVFKALGEALADFE